MSLAFLFHYLMLNMFRMLIHPSSGACYLFIELFHGLYCSVRIEVFPMAYLFSGECLDVTSGNIIEKHNTHKKYSITIRHRSSQYLQKHTF